ncbi:UBX domain-containing protein 11 [Diretmus argenteus]
MHDEAAAAAAASSSLTVTTHGAATGHQEYEATALDDDSSDLNPPPVTAPADVVPTSKSKASLKKGAPPSDLELMSSMMKRLTQLEIKVQSQAQEIERKNFLSDYGLIWVGDGETSDQQEEEEAEQIHTRRSERQSGTSVVRNFHMNFGRVLESIRELNIMAGEGQSFVQATATGAQLVQKKPVQLRLYSNGIIMFEGPFRSYQEHSTQRCMQDLMDGYFPSELRERFPDGVPFDVHDRREEEFIVRQPWAGKGQAVDGSKDKGLSSNTIASQIPGLKLAVDQFLNRLPKVVVKAGRVIDVRDSVKATLQGSSDGQNSNSVTLIDTPALQAMKERLDTSDCDQPSFAHHVTTLKVKSENGAHSYILKMHISETIGHLRQHLDKHRGVVSGYDIISVLPQRCYSDESQTLLSCGLTSNATLLLRMRQSTE